MRVGSILKFRIGSPSGESSAGFASPYGFRGRYCISVLGACLNFRIGSVPSIGGLIAATLFAATVSDFQCFDPAPILSPLPDRRDGKSSYWHVVRQVQWVSPPDSKPAQRAHHFKVCSAAESPIFSPCVILKEPSHKPMLPPHYPACCR